MAGRRPLASSYFNRTNKRLTSSERNHRLPCLSASITRCQSLPRLLSTLLSNIVAGPDTLMVLRRGFACWGQMNKVQEGIARLIQGTNSYGMAGAKGSQSEFLSWLAEAYLIAGQPEDGSNALVVAISHVEETGERYWEAELYRLKGELLLLPRGSEIEAGESFNQGLEIDRSQHAKSLELRAAMSMARLWQKQGKTTEARELLSGIYGWFIEGFDTPDLIDAKASLEELA